jgi:glyceraldehyde-3-phosphate dehydrogenase (NADP+)
MNIPEQYKIKETVNQNTYLVGGELKSWTGDTSEVYSTISSTEEYKPTLLGTIPTLGEQEALEALDAAVSAYKKGQGLWPTMKVVDRIACMEKFVKQISLKYDIAAPMIILVDSQDFIIRLRWIFFQGQNREAEYRTPYP